MFSERYNIKFVLTMNKILFPIDLSFSKIKKCFFSLGLARKLLSKRIQINPAPVMIQC